MNEPSESNEKSGTNEMSEMSEMSDTNTTGAADATGATDGDAPAPLTKLTISAEHAGRADLALAGSYPEVGRKRLSELFAQGAVRIGRRVVKKGDRLAAGDVVELAVVPSGRGDERPVADALAAARLTILLERPELVAVNKPAPMASQPLRAGELGSAASGIVARYPECASLGDDPRDGGVVHRLDIGTTGVLIAARTPEAYRALRDAFSAGTVSKTYLAITTARPVGNSCEAALSQRGRKVVVDEQDGLNAYTEVTVLSSKGDLYLVRCTAQTGRMHQVRAHLALLRSPILGDSLYGAHPVPALASVFPEHRFFLHAETVTLPFGGETLTIRAPLPAESQAVIDAAGLKL